MKTQNTLLKSILGFFLLLSPALSQATHNRAGEITYRLISGFTYEVTITTYTYSKSPADRPKLAIQWGDGTSTEVERVNGPGKYGVLLPNNYKWNQYVTQHTYPGPGSYNLLVQDPNRNLGIRNIPNSVNVIFSIKSTLVISPITGSNNTPVLLNPPIDRAALGRIFIHNPGAFDKDGDSLSYELSICTEEDGKPIKNYSLPKSSDTIYVNPITGDLVWDSPVDTGAYNVAIIVKEWRKGVLIGTVTRDMQIDVYRANNQPPENQRIQDLCVVAGTNVDILLTATDPNLDYIIIRGSGGPFEADSGKAKLDSVSAEKGISRARFLWQTRCEHVRERPYQITIKSTDINSELNLNDFDAFNIRVIGAAPEKLELSPSVNSVRLSWDPYFCKNILHFDIYRKSDPSDFSPDSCETGIPPSVGFKKITSTHSGTETTFFDDNNGKGLPQGFQYCYRIVAVFPDGAYSIASNEVCTELVPGVPALLNCSVTQIDENGSVYLAWLKPKQLDTIPANGPYEYIIYRSPDLWGDQFVPIDSFSSIDLSDTSYTDNPVNTILYPYSYKVELYNDAPGDRRLIGRPETASTLYPSLIGKDNKIIFSFVRNVPWINSRYIIQRWNETSASYDSIGYTDNESYIDSNLVNQQEYCYRIKSIGYRDFKDFTIPSLNLSHKTCAVPVDTTPPCAPFLFVSSNCDSLYNQLTWTNPNSFCSNDVIQYKIFYSSTLTGTLDEIAEITNPNDTSWKHYPVISLAGCYQLTAIDSFLNESPRSNIACVDICTFYELPNVFTPNGDNVNDIYLAKNKNHYVQKVDMKIYNRWGQLVFETADPDIKWDGKHMQNKNPVASGIYYYVCTVYEPRLTGIEERNLVGFIHVYAETGKQGTSDQ